jgi:UDP-glucose 4-epimerase
MSLKNKSVLVIGGAGFIGSHLVDQIIRDAPDNIIVVDNLFLGKTSNLIEAQKKFADLRFVNKDASMYEEMSQLSENECIDVAFNLAVIPLPASIERPSWTFKHNIDIALTACELARNDNIKTLIHFSSSEVYGSSIYAPMDENHPLNGTTTYAASKAASDLLVLSYYKMYNIDCSIIRPFNNFGPRQNEGSYAGVIPITIKRILSGISPVIYGDGKQTRDYIYVTDTAKAAIDIYNSPQSRGLALNIASGKEVSIEYLVHQISYYMGWKKGIVYEKERQGDVRRHIANIFLAEDLLDFRPSISFEDGLKKTIDWYKAHL